MLNVDLTIVRPLILTLVAVKNEVDKVLIVDDEPDIIELVAYILEQEGYQVQTATSGTDALAKAGSERPDLIMLDVMMPDMDGIEVCQRLRALPAFDSTFITFLTARGEDYSQIAGFEAGADDYIIKPIRPRTLVARIRSILKRKPSNLLVQTEHEIGSMTIDTDRRKVLINKKELHLPRKEFDLLMLLCLSPGKVFSREDIYRRLWNGDIVVGDRTIDVHIRKLRQKIGEDRIVTLKGVGYRFEA